MPGIGRPVYLRKGEEILETIDSVRFGHLLRFAHQTGKEWPTIEWLAAHPDGKADIDTQALVDELQRLALQQPPEDLAPMIGNLRNDAVRVTNMAGAGRPAR